MMLRSALFSLAAAAGFAMTAPVFAGTAQSSAADFEPFTQPIPLSIDRVKRNLGAEGVYIFDCNPQDIWEKSHLPGAVHINVNEWKKLLPKDKKNSYLIFYCINKMCTVSYETAQEALKEGYYSVYVMPDGIQGWVSHGMEFEGTGRNDPALEAARKAREAAQK